MKRSLAEVLVRTRSALLHVVGFTCLTVAASIAATWAGWAMGGVSCFLLAYLSEERPQR